MSGWLVIFAKEPRPEHVKTRMTPPLSPQEAADLYACLLQDALEVTAAAARALGLVPMLAVDPPQAVAPLVRGAPAGFRGIAQRGRDLGQRVAHAVAQAGAAGASPILVRGSDSPALDVASFARALDALAAADLALSPDRDGGYNLVGLRHPVPGLFEHPMSTPRVLEDTLANANRLGLGARLLPASFDVDTVEDLGWLDAARRASPELPCPRTLAFLDAHGLWSRSRPRAAQGA